MSEDTVKLKRLELFAKYAREDRIKADAAARRAYLAQCAAADELHQHVMKMVQREKTI